MGGHSIPTGSLLSFPEKSVCVILYSAKKGLDNLDLLVLILCNSEVGLSGSNEFFHLASLVK